MAKTVPPRVVTANDLMSGRVVYMTAAGSWSPDYRDAVVANDAGAADALLKAAGADEGRIVGPYLAAVAVDNAGRPHPVHFREIVRTRGPGNRAGRYAPTAGGIGAAAQGA